MKTDAHSKVLPSGFPARPPAVWTAFAEQSRWKTWGLIVLAGLNVCEAVALVAACRREPDVVLVADDGRSTYLNRSVAGDALTQFLAEQRQMPSDATVMHFTRSFVQAFLSANASTIEASFPEALSMMGPSTRARYAKEAKAQKLVETVRAAQLRTEVSFEALSLEERQGKVLRLKGTVKRLKSNLLDAANPTSDRLEFELVERVVPRSVERPDGLEVAEYTNKVL